MSEIEHVLDDMRKTSEHVTELESALYDRASPSVPTRKTKLRSAPRPALLKHRPIRGILAALDAFRPVEKPERSLYWRRRQVVDQLRAKQQFLQETRKQLRRSERSVDELTAAIRTAKMH
jgi:phage shock protein A